MPDIRVFLNYEQSLKQSLKFFQKYAQLLEKSLKKYSWTLVRIPNHKVEILNGLYYLIGIFRLVYLREIDTRNYAKIPNSYKNYIIRLFYARVSICVHLF